jgi:hypothetical protein
MGQGILGVVNTSAEPDDPDFRPVDQSFRIQVVDGAGKGGELARALLWCICGQPVAGRVRSAADLQDHYASRRKLLCCERARERAIDPKLFLRDPMRLDDQRITCAGPVVRRIVQASIYPMTI